MEAERVAISLPKELVEKAEKARKNWGINRSQLYRSALKSYLEKFLETEEDRKLSKIYKEVRETDKKLQKYFARHSYKNLPTYEK